MVLIICVLCNRVFDLNCQFVYLKSYHKKHILIRESLLHINLILYLKRQKNPIYFNFSKPFFVFGAF